MWFQKLYKKQQHYLSRIKKLELNEREHIELIDYCNKCGIKFLSTAFDFESINLLKKFNIPFFKIPSGEIINLPYLRKVATSFDKIVMSTGMATMDEVKAAYNVLLDNRIKSKNIIILHCNTEYPTPMEDVNLKAMIRMQEELNVKVGYSDHTLGIEVPIAAIAMGACVIEKHFTLDRNLSGPDHAASLEPNELTAMVRAIRNIEKALNGNGIKEPSMSEIKNIQIVRKSIHVSNNLFKGQLINEEDLSILRPNTGISPMQWNEVIGKRVKKDILKGKALQWENII